jgi:chromosome segregation ATPase
MYHRVRLGHNLTEITLLNDPAGARKGTGAAEEETVMPTDGFEDRLRELESEVAGEKLVTRHVLEQNRRNIDNLLALRADIGTVKLDLGTVTARIDYLAGDVAQIHAAVVGHTTVLNVLMQDVGLLRTAQNALAHDVGAMRTTMNEHTQAIGAIRTTLNEHSQEIGAIRTTINEHAQEIRAIRTTLNEHAQEFRTIRTTLNEHTQEFRTTRTTLNEHTQTLSEHSQEFSAIRTTLDALAHNVAAILAALAPRTPLPHQP